MDDYKEQYLDIKCKNLSKKMKYQFLDCCGIYCDEDGKLDKIIDNRLLDNMYVILNKSFGDISLNYYEYQVSSANEYYIGCDVKYNIDGNGLKETKSYNYSELDFTVNGLNVWTILKNEIDKKAKENHITIRWGKSDNEVYPKIEYEDFYRLCLEVLDSHGGLEELSSIKKSKPLTKIKINSKIFDIIINKAKEKQYSELVSVLEKIV